MTGVSAQAIPFYKVGKNGRASYLLGTDHSAPGNLIPERIRQRIVESRLILVETSKSGDDARSDIYEFIRKNSDPRRDLKKLFKPVEWIKFKRFLAEAEFPADLFRGLHPTAALSLIEQAFLEADARNRDEGYNRFMPELDIATDASSKALVVKLKTMVQNRHNRTVSKVNVDQTISDLGQKKQIPILDLDSDLLSAMTTKPVSEIELKNFIRQHLAAQLTPEQWYQRLKAHPELLLIILDDSYGGYFTWTPGDPIHSPSLRPEVFDPSSSDRITSRHTDWLSTIERELDSGNAFIGVGMAHLADEKVADGLITLLERDGYRVEFIGENCEESLKPSNTGL